MAATPKGNNSIKQTIKSQSFSQLQGCAETTTKKEHELNKRCDFGKEAIGSIYGYFSN